MKVFKEFTFEAAHFLIGVPPEHKCRRMHGHSYGVRVTCEGAIDEHTGMVIDYADIAKAWEPIHERLDHHFLNDIPELKNSTSEVLARYICHELRADLGDCVVEVEVRETPSAGAIYP